VFYRERLAKPHHDDAAAFCGFYVSGATGELFTNAATMS
jgi:hypothetical protein